MTHIQSIFDLCADIQERIGKELAPRVKSRIDKKHAIYQCKYLMEKLKVLQLEDHTFERCWSTKGVLKQFYSELNLGQVFLFLRKYAMMYDLMSLKSCKTENEYYRILMPMIKRHQKRRPEIDLRRFYIHGIPVEHTKTKKHDYKLSMRYTNHKRLNLTALQNGIKMPESWKKHEKIHHLMKTEE